MNSKTSSNSKTGLNSKPKQGRAAAPLVAPVLFWCLGIVLARMLALPAWPYLAAGSGVLGLALLFRYPRLWLALLVCLALGALRYQLAQRPSALDRVFESRELIQRRGEFIVSKAISPRYQLYEIRLNRLGGRALDEKILLGGTSRVEVGRSYSALLRIEPGRRDAILETYPPRHRARILYELKELPSKAKLLPLAIWRVKLLERLDAALGEDAAFAKALLLSDLAAKNQYSDKLRRGGMVHLIVVSGLHVWFIYFVSMILLNLALPRRTAEAAFLLLICLFAALNYWSPPILRAVLMIGIFTLARWQSRWVAREQLIALSLLIVSLIDPRQIFDLGLQLSYLSVGVILLAVPRLHIHRLSKRHPNLVKYQTDKVLHYMLLSAVVSVAILPLTLYHFGTASLNGIVGNLIAVPLTAILLALSFMAMILPWTALIASYRMVLLGFERWMDFSARLPLWWENAQISIWQYWALILLAGCLLWLINKARITPLLLGSAGLGLVLLIVPPLLQPLKPGIYLLNAGTADCIVVQLEQGVTLMVDTGPYYHDSNQSWALKRLLPWFRRKSVRDIDYLVLTHLDADHSGGFADIMSRCHVGTVFISPRTENSVEWQAWRDSGLLKRSSVCCVRDTMSVFSGGARLKFLHPDRGYRGFTDNNYSLLFRLDAAGQRYLFTGDVERPAEQYLLRRYAEELKADCLKAGHHGSRGSSSEEFVEAVNPREVWITAGANNRWGFPHEEALQAFRRHASEIRSTARGSIMVPFPQKD